MSRQRATPPVLPEAGFSLVEVLVALTIVGLATGAMAGMLIQNSQINRAQQMEAQTQADARQCLTMITQVVRSAGWDPLNTGIAPFVFDTTPLDAPQFLEVHADLNEDGDTDDEGEEVHIRRSGEKVEWRLGDEDDYPFVTLAENIINDSDGDGVAEAMFVPDSTTNPTRVIVRITARSALPDSRSGAFYRYTLSSEVAVRKAL
jgi:type IV pilus assembly protein PilW